MRPEFNTSDADLLRAIEAVVDRSAKLAGPLVGARLAMKFGLAKRLGVSLLAVDQMTANYAAEFHDVREIRSLGEDMAGKQRHAALVLELQGQVLREVQQ